MESTAENVTISIDEDVVVGSSSNKSPDRETHKLVAPFVGMIFNSVDDAKTYYKQYGLQEGFETRVRSTDRKKGVDFATSCLMVCAREGVYKREVGEVGLSKNTSTVKCSCPAKMRIMKRKHEEMYSVSCVENEHSHGLVSPAKRNCMRSKKNMPEAAKRLTEIFSENGLPVGKVAAVFNGEELGFTKKDCWNHHYGLTRKMPKEGDATAVLRYFMQKSADDPQFYYAIDLDENGTAVNFFWVDGRSRVQYEYFGDVVSFDTTYRTNAYSMPFAPFTGVNHHMQSIQFGCALLLDETEDTFIWLFKAWLAAMGGRAPTAIITDQDRAMTAAIAKVFPNTRHRYCLWHIMQKFQEKLSFTKIETLVTDLKNTISFSYRISDFERRWRTIIENNELPKNPWLTEMYNIRERWVPCYLSNTFFAGMHTTGRSESMNSHYDQFVNSTTRLMEFVHGNERSLALIARNERDFDYRTEHSSRIVAKDAFLLMHAASVYTINAFNKFKEQLEKAKMEYKIHGDEIVDNGIGSYMVKFRDPQKKSVWKVSFNRRILEGDCECKYFQFMGLLCGHMLKIFQRYEIKEIPRHFLLNRWMQKANTYRAEFDTGLVVGHENHEPLRVAHCIKVASQVAYDAGNSVEAYSYFIEKMGEMSIGVSKLKETSSEGVADNEEPSVEEHSIDTSQILILNPNISQTKGRKNNVERWKSPREIALNNLGRMCRNCGKIANHDSRNCPEKNKT